MFVAWMAASAPSLISTPPNPRLRPVSRSVTTDALVTVPYSPNRPDRSSDVAVKDRFPTYNFLLTKSSLRRPSARPPMERTTSPPDRLSARTDVRTQAGHTALSLAATPSNNQGRGLERTGSEQRNQEGSE